MYSIQVPVILIDPMRRFSSAGEVEVFLDDEAANGHVISLEQDQEVTYYAMNLIAKQRLRPYCDTGQ